MSEQFEVDQLHGDKKPATPPETLPDQGGEFERQAAGICTRWEYVPNFPVEIHNSTIDYLAAAHNRDMSKARKKIAELEAELAGVDKENDDLSRWCTAKNKMIAEYKQRLTALEAENAKIRADKAELVEMP